MQLHKHILLDKLLAHEPDGGKSGGITNPNPFSVFFHYFPQHSRHASLVNSARHRSLGSGLAQRTSSQPWQSLSE